MSEEISNMDQAPAYLFFAYMLLSAVLVANRHFLNLLLKC